MSSRLYKLALWYIEKCNSKLSKRNLKNDLESLDRLTYWNFGKYMLLYGSDAEWRKFSRYEVLDNAIQKLAKYENDEQEIRNKAIEEFAERLKTDLQGEHWTQFCTMREMIDRIAESMKGEKE